MTESEMVNVHSGAEPALDIGPAAVYPTSELSNFASHPFEFESIHCASMEGFLQCLKFQDEAAQKEVCALAEKSAKFKGKKKKWWRDQKLYWKGHVIDR